MILFMQTSKWNRRWCLKADEHSLPNACIYYNMVKNNSKLPKTIPHIQPQICQFQCIFNRLMVFILSLFSFFLFCSPERSVVEWIFWLWIFLGDHATLGPDCGGWQSQVRALLFWKLFFLPTKNKKGTGHDYRDLRGQVGFFFLWWWSSSLFLFLFLTNNVLFV